MNNNENNFRRTGTQPVPQSATLRDFSPARPVAAVESETMRTYNPNWLVTVQREQRVQCPCHELDRVIPGYVQVDDVTGGQNNWSKSPQTLVAEGCDLPEAALHFDRLPSGQYTFEQALHWMRQETEQWPDLPHLQPVTAELRRVS
jgi:hypothetical protein